MNRVAYVLLFGLVTTFSMATAGDRSNIRGMGMARTFNATSRGTDALGINPANLGMRDRGVLSLSIAPMGLRISSDFISYDIYQEFFTGVPDSTGKRVPKYLTIADKEKIIGSFRDGLVTTRMDFEAMLAGISIYHPSIGGIGFAIREHAGARLVLPKDYIRFFLFGLDSAGSHYVFDGTAVSAWWWREFNLSYGFRVPVKLQIPSDIYAGFALKFIRGYGNIETTHYRASITNTRVGTNQYRADLGFDYLTRRSGVDFLDENKQSGVTPFPEPAGKGTGFDFGISAVMPGFFLHASVTDIGKINWERNIVETYGSYSLSLEDPFSDANQDTIELAVKGTNRPGSNFSTSLPSMLRFGVALQSDSLPFFRSIPGSMVLAVDYNQGLNESLGNVTKPRLSLGVEYRLIPLIPFRTGLSFGGGDKPRWAAGIGIDLYFLSFDIASENFGMLFSPKDFDMFSFAAGLKVRI